MQKNVSLETAKRLKEAGWSGKTEKYWLDPSIDWMDGDYRLEFGSYVSRASQISCHERGIPAPDTAELLEALDNFTDDQALSIHPQYSKGEIAWVAGYLPFAPYRDVNDKKLAWGISPAEALAELWLALNSK